MESGLNAVPDDYARFGLLFLHDGAWNGRQILPAGRVAEATTPLRPDPRRYQSAPGLKLGGGYYKYHWWGLNNPDGSYDYWAQGKLDQIVYVAPRKNIVIVRLGERPDDDLVWALALRNLVDQM
jgi:CubicO group peptidase (beta-lactamase class C family)